jgi:hypothetical protein
MKRDFDYYIKAARKAENHSEGLWRGMNQCIRSVLETQRKNGKSLDEVASILDRLVGSRKKKQPVCFENLRVSAKQIRAREKLVLI